MKRLLVKFEGRNLKIIERIREWKTKKPLILRILGEELIHM